MPTNKTSLWIFILILILGIYSIPKIILHFKDNGSLIKIGSAPKFELVNQDNVKINNETYKGKVYVLEFFFSTCPTICPKMNQSMLQIENKFLGHPNFGIVSISIDPEHDTATVLKAHRELLGVKSPNWNFLTGEKSYIFNLSNKGFNLFAGENKKSSGGFEHSGLFALIDKNGTIRCRKDDAGNPIIYYNGLDKKGVSDIQQDIAILLKEE